MPADPKTLPVVPVTESSSCCGDDCCGGTGAEKKASTEKTVRGLCAPTAEQIAEGVDPRTLVRERYGAVAEGIANSCGCCQGPEDAEAVLSSIGYTAEQAAAIPEGANLGLGCGNPIEHAALKSGEVVLDLGSGAGIDCFLAAREIGPTGRAIGVDMTPQMLERARALARKLNVGNVEFRLGEIEHLPLADASVDVIISNCVVNLSPEKLQVFREALRVLKPGGRLMVSDLVLTKPLSPQMQKDAALYVGCVSGASLESEYLQLMREAGFTNVEVLARTGYTVGMDTLPEGSPEREAFESVVSVKVRAVRTAT